MSRRARKQHRKHAAVERRLNVERDKVLHIVARIIADKTGKPVYLKRRPRITSRRDGFTFAGN